MSGASISYRAHVPCWRSLCIDREPVAVRICARLRWRAHSNIKNAQTPPAIQSAAFPCFGGAIASRPSLWLRRLAGKLERSGPVADGVRFPAIFPRQGTFSGFCNLRGAFSALRSLLLRSLVQHPEKSGRSVGQALFLAPAFLSVPVLHRSNRHQKDTRDHGNSYPQHG